MASKTHFVVQRWFRDGEGWAYDEGIPKDLRIEAVGRVTDVAERYEGSRIESSCQCQNWKLFIFVLPDKKCLDPKASKRNPHIDVGILVPEKLVSEEDFKNPLVQQELKRAQSIEQRGILRSDSSEGYAQKSIRIFLMCLLGGICALLLVVFGVICWNLPDKEKSSDNKDVIPGEAKEIAGTSTEAADFTETDKIIKEWKIPAFNFGYDHGLQGFSREINSWLDTIRQWNIKPEYADNPDAAFFLNLQRVCGMKRLPDFESGMSQADFQKKLREVCEIFGVSEFQDIEKTISYKRFFEETFVKERLEQTIPLPETEYAMIHEEAFKFWPEDNKRVDTSHLKDLKNTVEKWTKERGAAWQFTDSDRDKCPQLRVWLYFHHTTTPMTMKQAEQCAFQREINLLQQIKSLRKAKGLCPLVFEYEGQNALEEYLQYCEVEKRLEARENEKHLEARENQVSSSQTSESKE